MQLALFIIFGGLAVVAALNLLLQRHPINSALSLVVVMMSLAVLYWSLGAEFLAAAQVIVYAGAIMVLFVFVVMLLNAGAKKSALTAAASPISPDFPGAPPSSACSASSFLSERKALGFAHLGGTLSTSPTSNLTEISTMLFTRQLLPFEVTSVLILIAILGAVVLARKEQ